MNNVKELSPAADGADSARQAAILNALPANIALLDTAGMITSVNVAWRRFASANVLHGAGYGVGLNYLDICDHAQGDDSFEARQAAAGVRSVLRGAVESFSIEYPCHSPTERRWFLLKVAPLAGNGANGAVVMHLDITVRKLAEQRLQDLNATLEQRVIDRTAALDAKLSANTALAESLRLVNEQLTREIDERRRAQEAQRASEARMHVREAQSNRLEAIGTLAAGIGHEFNTILGIINGYAELLSDDFPSHSREGEKVRHIIASCFRARDLIVRMLDFARQRPIDPLSVDAVSLIKEALELIRVSLPPGVKIVFEPDLRQAHMVADPLQIHQIVMNLCTNAADAMNGQGRLRIGIRRSPLLVTGGFFQRPRFCLEVADNGCGMPAEVQQRAFDPFYTTKEPGKGSGLGLSVIYGIVSDLGGEIQIQSEVGVGTRFNIHLPLLEQDQSGTALEQ